MRKVSEVSPVYAFSVTGELANGKRFQEAFESLVWDSDIALSTWANANADRFPAWWLVGWTRKAKGL